MSVSVERYYGEVGDGSISHLKEISKDRSSVFGWRRLARVISNDFLGAVDAVLVEELSTSIGANCENRMMRCASLRKSTLVIFPSLDLLTACRMIDSTKSISRRRLRWQERRLRRRMRWR